MKTSIELLLEDLVVELRIMNYLTEEQMVREGHYREDIGLDTSKINAAYRQWVNDRNAKRWHGPVS